MGDEEPTRHHGVMGTFDTLKKSDDYLSNISLIYLPIFIFLIIYDLLLLILLCSFFINYNVESRLELYFAFLFTLVIPFTMASNVSLTKPNVVRSNSMCNMNPPGVECEWVALIMTFFSVYKSPYCFWRFSTTCSNELARS